MNPKLKKPKLHWIEQHLDKDSFENHLKFVLKEDYNEFKYAKDNIKHYSEILKGF